MANIHGSEPQAQGLITFKTNFGDIDIELFTKQCPKVTKNFVQFCLDRYYDNISFTRVEKDFIAVAGDSEEDFEAETEIEHAPDEFHSRLKFTRRGLLATANTKKDENGQAFFFTLGPTPELQNKHTIFGRVLGNTVFSLVDLNECQVDDDLRPTTNKIITQVIVKENPFPKLVPRSNFTKSIKQVEDIKSLPIDDYDPLAKPRIDPTKLKKLSFFPEYNDDDDEEEEDKGQSSRQVTTKSEAKTVSINSTLLTSSVIEQSKVKDTANAEHKTKVHDGDDKLDAREKRLRDIREQIRSIKEQIEKEPEIKTLSERRQMSNDSQKSEQSSADAGKLEDTVDGIQLRIAGKKSKLREKETIEIVTNFKKKLRKVASNEPKVLKQSEVIYDDLDELAALDKVDGDEWLNHKFDATDDGVRLAKDANTKDESWYSIDDPRRDASRKGHHSSSQRSHLHRDSDNRRRLSEKHPSSSRSRN